ncbi:MAG: hypothetical protein AB7I32_09135 [Gammaproteobacteria bacterium]
MSARARLTAALLLAFACMLARADDFPLSLAIGKLVLPGGLSFSGISFECARLGVDGGMLACTDGALAVRDSPLGALRLPFTARSDGVDSKFSAPAFAFAGGRLGLTLEIERGVRRVRARLVQVELPALHAFAKSLLPGQALLAAHELTRGTLDLDLDCRLEHEGGALIVGDCAARGRIAALDLAGTNSAEGATLRFDLAQQRHARLRRWRGELALEAGALYLEPGFKLGELTPGLLLQVEDGPIVAEVIASRDAAGRLGIERCHLRHPGVAELAFDGDASLLPAPGWREARLRFSTAALARFYAVYLQPLLLGSSLGGLRAAGGLDVDLRVAAGRTAELDVDCRDCAFDDERGRFAVAGLDGGLRLHDGATPRVSTLSWRGASVYRIALGPGRIGWRSAHGTLEAVDWQDVTIYDGALHLDDMRLEDFGSARARLVLAGRIEPITLSKLTTSFGWVPLAGSITGTIPSLTISRGRIGVDGDLDIGVFGGHVVLANPSITDVFGAVPLLRTDVRLRGLDLAQLTSTFAFGNIEGHLEGEIADLRLEAWQAVSFDAFLATPEDDDVPHRISRQAVDNLSRIGAGTGGPLASGWLGLIPSYSFGRLGLGCRLANGICQLRGVEAVPGGGFKLLTRGGWLPPWIEIRGAGEQVAWQTLLDGVEQIAQGGVEVEVNVGRAGTRPAEQQP